MHVFGAEFSSDNNLQSRLAVSCFDTYTNAWEIVSSPLQRSWTWQTLSLSTVRGSVLGTSVVSNGSDVSRWFSQAAEQEESEEECDEVVVTILLD